ncbi:MAG: hypothetical protein IPM29_05765 [Planctomycetes bacterium]|nr:hypothetical protein [Planctomycetota bacterium]
MTTKPRLFLESRYRKLVRDLPQTIYYCPQCGGRRRRREQCTLCGGAGRLADDSVQELLARKLLPAFRARSGKFHGAGREDIDVRMLGRGRPFVFELVGPRQLDVDLVDLVERFHRQHGERVQLTEPLREVPRARVAELKEGHYAKRYRLGVATAVAFDAERLAAELAGRRATLRQRTPQRVAHRRADVIRERGVRILALRVPGDDGLALELDLETDHGTYVKEFVSGDDGRTEPSFAAWLGGPATCARLDVLEILDGPAFSPA